MQTRNADDALTGVVGGQEPAHAGEEEERPRGDHVAEAGVCGGACVCVVICGGKGGYGMGSGLIGGVIGAFTCTHTHILFTHTHIYII